MAKKEWVLIFAMFLIGGVFVIESLRLGLGSIHSPGAGFLPFCTGAALSLAAVSSLIKIFLKAKRETGKEEEKFFGRPVLNVVAIVVALIDYVFIVPRLGYLLSTFMLLIFLFKAGFPRPEY